MQGAQANSQIKQLWQQAQDYYARGKGEWPKAIEAYSKALQIAPNYVPLFVQRGLVLQEMGETGRAMQDFERAIQLDPNYGPAYYGRGWSKSWQGDYEGELQDAMRGLELDPNDPGSYYRRMGTAYKGMKKYDQAIEAYNSALSIHPTD